MASSKSINRTSVSGGLILMRIAPTSTGSAGAAATGKPVVGSMAVADATISTLGLIQRNSIQASSRKVNDEAAVSAHPAGERWGLGGGIKRGAAGISWADTGSVAGP